MIVSQFPQRRTKNLLINAGFRVNQRAYVSGTATAAADEYTLDRWRVLVSGESITFSALGADNKITAPAGGLGQKIESINIKGGVYTVQWSGSATCKVNGVERKTGESFVINADTEADVVFYGGDVNKPQLESGSIVTEFEYRNIEEELILCRRFFERIGPANNRFIALIGARSSSVLSGEFVFHEKRVSPSVSCSVNGFALLGINGEELDYMAFNKVSKKNAEVTWGDVNAPFVARESVSLIFNDSVTYIDIDAEL